MRNRHRSTAEQQMCVMISVVALAQSRGRKRAKVRKLDRTIDEADEENGEW